jgi:hypothetical protein
MEPINSDLAAVDNGGGCHPSDLEGRDLGQIVLLNPEWSPVVSGRSVDSEPVLVHGIAHTPHGDTGGDFPATHLHSDYTVSIEPDPEDKGRLATGNIDEEAGTIELEWESGLYADWAWASEGDRLIALGRWIFDCGHPGHKPRTCLHDTRIVCTGNMDCPGDVCDRQHYGYQTEIHPPQAVAAIRQNKNDVLSTDPRAPAVPVARADIFVSPDGGGAGDRCVLSHHEQEGDIVFNTDCFPLSQPVAPINAYDFAFELTLPPRPSPGARVAWRRIAHATPGGVPASVNIEERIEGASPYIFVRVNMTERTELGMPTGFAETLLAGWIDAPTPSPPLAHLRVELDSVVVLDPLKPAIPIVRDAKGWRLQASVNGAWQKLANLQDVDGPSEIPQAIAWDLYLAPTDVLSIFADGVSSACVDTMFGQALKSSLGQLGLVDVISCIETDAKDPGRVEVEYAGPDFGAGAGAATYETMSKGGDATEPAFAIRYRITRWP